LRRDAGSERRPSLVRVWNAMSQAHAELKLLIASMHGQLKIACLGEMLRMFRLIRKSSMQMN